MPDNISTKQIYLPVVLAALLGISSTGIGTFFAVKFGVESNRSEILEMTQSIEKLANSVHDLSLQTKVDLARHEEQLEQVDRRVTTLETTLASR